LNPSNRNSNIQAVLFDLDGTLLDTARDMMEALNQLRAEENRAPLSYETVRCQVSHGGHALVPISFSFDLTKVSKSFSFSTAGVD
jgi:phosphoglycolate phosphatase